MLTEQQVLDGVRKMMKDNSVQFKVNLAKVIAHEQAVTTFKPEAYKTDPQRFDLQGMGMFVAQTFHAADPVHEICAAALEDINYHETAAMLRG